MKKLLGAFRKRTKWKAAITISNVQIHLGTYITELEAAKAYDAYVLVNGISRSINNVNLFNSVYNPKSRDACILANNATKRVQASKDFEAKANMVHNNAYTYSKALYTLAKNKLTVTCISHGDFNVTANNHLRGKGCPACANSKKGWNRGIYTSVHTILYVVLVDKTFYKIGITKKSIKERYSSDRLKGVAIDVVYEHCFIHGEDAFNIEKLLLKKTYANRYKGSTTILPNGGDTELRTYVGSTLYYDTIKEYYENKRTTV